VNNPDDVAAALTALEGDMYSRIRPADYINHLQGHQGPNRVTEAQTATLKITFWVKQRVLHSDDIKRRGRMLKFYLRIAKVGFSDCLEA
jgi:RasGEF domain